MTYQPKSLKTTDLKDPETNVLEAINIRGLGVEYGKAKALAPTNLDISAGNITALIGPSGCGKTSFLLCLNRLIDLVPGAGYSGQVIVQGEDILGKNIDVQSVRSNIGMVFQKPNPFPFSIRRNFDLVFDSSRFGNSDLREKIMYEKLEAVGLLNEISDRLDRPATELSGGQQQRLCIARALATNPKILLLDEPCSALDPISTMKIENLIASLKKDITLVVVTHNLAQAKRLADDCALFWCDRGTGYLLESGSMQSLVDNPQNRLTSDYLSGKLA